MTRIGLALLAAAFATSAVLPVRAAPPTVTPSPGYDARLQEQRTAPPLVQPPLAPVVTRSSPPRKRTHKH